MTIRTVKRNWVKSCEWKSCWLNKRGAECWWRRKITRRRKTKKKEEKEEATSGGRITALRRWPGTRKGIERVKET